MRLYRRLQFTWQLLTKIDIRAQVEPAVEPSLPVADDPMRLAQLGLSAVTDRGELQGHLDHIRVTDYDQPATDRLSLGEACPRFLDRP